MTKFISGELGEAMDKTVKDRIWQKRYVIRSYHRWAAAFGLRLILWAFPGVVVRIKLPSGSTEHPTQGDNHD